MQAIERQDAIPHGKTQPKRPWQLRIWQVITAQSDVYKKDAKLCVDSPPDLRLALQ